MLQGARKIKRVDEQLARTPLVARQVRVGNIFFVSRLKIFVVLLHTDPVSIASAVRQRDRRQPLSVSVAEPITVQPTPCHVGTAP